MRRRASSFGLGALVVALASCTALPPPQEWVGGSEPASAAGAPAGSAEPEARTLAGELTWERAVEIARLASPTVHGAVERIHRAEAVLEEAEALAYPRIDLRGSYVRFIEAANFRGRTGTDVSGEGTRTRFFTQGGTDIYSGGVDVSYPLFDGGDAYYARKAAGAAVEAARLDARSVLRELGLRVFAAFIDVLLAEGAIEIAEEALRFAEEQVRQARAREDVGEGLRVDRLRFETRVSEGRLALNRGRAERRIRIAVLSELMGVELGDTVVLVQPEAGLAVPEEAILSLALATRPEMRALRVRVEEARNRLLQEESSWWPRLNLFTSYGVISLDNMKLDHEKDELLAGGSLSMNLFEGGATSARIAARRHEFAAAQSLEEELALRVTREVRESSIALEVAAENVEVSGETLALAQEVLERVSAQYAAGEAQVIDVTEAELQRRRAQLELLQSRAALLLSQARLRRAAGLDLERGR